MVYHCLLKMMEKTFRQNSLIAGAISSMLADRVEISAKTVTTNVIISNLSFFEDLPV